MAGPWQGTACLEDCSLPEQHVIRKEALHTGSHLRRRMSSRPVSGCTGRHGYRTKRTRQRLAMETVSCSAPTTPGQSPPTPIFTRFSKLQGASSTT
ncbi:unnamed protein product [Strongylus vulgaris]|uniref:Uncharacterized protein n=1 Tax=Strongylus vulgaris TaxID=40348 RepID=A0A3P7JCC6_STRVU|nr:unnamed protein product [Strongylus vulgaris]